MLVNQPRVIVISEEEARHKILDVVRALPARAVPLLEALDCFAQRDLFARIASPRFDNSSMDGYALVAGSSPKNAQLKIIGEQAAGIDRELRVGAGEAIRILTGAPIPRGADAVIMQEDVRIEGEQIITTSEVEPGENVRRCGADVTEGQKLLSLGERIRPSTVALLAAQGFSEVEIGGEVRASIVTTGDEIVPPGTALQPGQIYDSNSPLLHSLANKAGAKVISVEHCADDAQKMEEAFRAAENSDVLIISGGVSVGARDFVKPALSAIGASLDLWRVSLKPGKPFLFGRAGKCLIFGLPGNPVSAYMTFLLFVRPAILKLLGANDAELKLTQVPARLRGSLQNPGDRPHYFRGRLTDGTFSPVGRQESHAIFGLHQSNALLRIPAHESHADGAEVAVLLPLV
ncbi:MAG: molybdopterin molybdotransferase MoeA [Verrucomicrobiota bacterium]|nr:molybdopterin molybdotransferase MoeA [Verrucomicrobiota bacterium]